MIKNIRHKKTKKAVLGTVIAGVSLLDKIGSKVGDASMNKVEYDEYGMPINKDQFIKSNRTHNLTSIGGLTSWAVGGFKSGKKELAEMEAEANDLKAIETTNRFNRDSAILKTDPSLEQGNGDAYFALGGDPPTKKGSVSKTKHGIKVTPEMVDVLSELKNAGKLKDNYSPRQLALLAKGKATSVYNASDVIPIDGQRPIEQPRNNNVRTVSTVQQGDTNPLVEMQGTDKMTNNWSKHKLNLLARGKAVNTYNESGVIPKQTGIVSNNLVDVNNPNQGGTAIPSGMTTINKPINDNYMNYLMDNKQSFSNRFNIPLDKVLNTEWLTQNKPEVLNTIREEFKNYVPKSNQVYKARQSGNPVIDNIDFPTKNKALGGQIPPYMLNDDGTIKDKYKSVFDKKPNKNEIITDEYGKMVSTRNYPLENTLSPIDLIGGAPKVTTSVMKNVVMGIGNISKSNLIKHYNFIPTIANAVESVASNKALGGDIVPINSDTKIVQANNPNKLDSVKTNIQGQPLNVDNGEMIHNINGKTILISSKLGNLSNIDKELSLEKANLEKINTPQSKARIAQIDKQILGLYNKQESFKKANGLKDDGTHKFLGGTDNEFSLNREDNLMNPNKDKNNNFIDLLRTDNLMNPNNDTDITERVISPREYGIKKLGSNSGEFTNNNVSGISELSQSEIDKIKGTEQTSNKPDGIKEKMSSANLGEITNIASTFIDNGGNEYLRQQLKKKKVPPPEMLKYVALNTTMNINPSLRAIDNNLASTKQMLAENGANSNITNSKIASEIARASMLKSSLHQTKENTETGLKNQSYMNIQGVDQINKGKMDDYKTNKFNKEVLTDITMPSQNLQNLSGDITNAINRKDMRNFQNAQLQLESLKHGDTGVYVGTMEQLIKNNNYKPSEESLIAMENDAKYKDKIDRIRKMRLDLYGRR